MRSWARFSSVINVVMRGISICFRIRASRLRGSLSRSGKPARASSSRAVTDRTIYDFESSARPTKTGIIEMIKRETARKTVKKVIKMPSTSGIFHLRSFTTNGQRRSAKKHEIKNKPIKSRSK